MYVPSASTHRGRKAVEGANNIVWVANAVFMRAVMYTSNYKAVRRKNVSTVALTTHKAVSLRHKFGENMKGDSKLLITEATKQLSAFVGFANLLVDHGHHIQQN